MKKLTLRSRLGKANINALEELLKEKLPDDFSSFVTANAGLNHNEYIYYDPNKNRWEVSQYNVFKDLYGLTEEFLNQYKRKLIPFAYDPGGWHFCLSLDKQTYGAIYINKWTDHLPDEQFEKIADSFEEFIDGLKSEE